MKKILLVLLSCSGALFCKAQKDSAFFEIGMNVASVIHSFGDEDNRFELSPYFLTLEKSFGKVGLRSGFGMYNSQSEQLASPSNGNTNFNIDTASVDVRLGLVFYKNLNEKWSLKYGLDGVISNQSSSRNTSFTNTDGQESEIVSSRTFSGVGVAPFLMAQYHFSKNISIGTEIGFRWLNGTTVDESVNDQFPEFNENLETTQTTLSLLAPTALFLVVRL